ncbi:right-handed parallel beta-helix repeat-containing protein [Geminisphaera colitermitum]|uniref:right-handed parallel beta-helix repeat-containing protein n=1 Tax=Geminisphaera colitermitum TaxID=1148786 RepID=UPI000158D491|nr:right-handed parallel beta-helix repeat-containing protein [Geminisphaera colitermitum]
MPHPLPARSIAFLATALALQSAPPDARWLHIDPRDPAALPTLAAASAQARPGDTLWLAPGSGPYREELFIPRSGTPDAPITIEGNGNEITGFDIVAFSPERIANVTTDYPFVLRHHGVRIPEDALTGQFTPASSASAITYDPAGKTLTLGPDVTPDGWEISTRRFAARIHNVSHHRYRNLTASGSRNDGFNLHGRGTGLLFENITACHNLDEGFSAHDDIESEIREGRFFGNDNGIYNIQRSRTRVRDLLIWDNLGIGLCQREATLEGENVRIWGNGMVQLATEKSGVIRVSNLIVHRNPHTTRLWRTYMESAKWAAAPATLGREIRQPGALSGLIEQPISAPWDTAP